MTISNASCIAQINAAPLPDRTPREKRIRKIAELTRAIAIAQKDAEHYRKIRRHDGEQINLDFIARKVKERDRLMLTTDDGDELSASDPDVVRYLGTPETRAAVESTISAFDPDPLPVPEFTAPLPEAMPETQADGGTYF